MTDNPFAALLAGVSRHYFSQDSRTFLPHDEVLAALAAAVPADLAEAGKVLEPLSKLADDMDRHATDEWDESELICKTGDVIRLLLARIAAQEAQIKGLVAENRDMVSLSSMLTDATNRIEELEAAIDSQDAQEAGLWRFWSRKATELADKVRDLTEGQARAEQEERIRTRQLADETDRAEAAETALAAERAKVAKLAEAGKRAESIIRNGQPDKITDAADLLRAAITEAGQ